MFGGDAPVNRLASAVHHNSAAVADFVEAIEARDPRAVVIVCGDHLPLLSVRSGEYMALDYRPSRQLGRSDPWYSNDGRSGRFRWRGRVDGSDYIMLSGNRVSIQHVAARQVMESSFDLPTPLPRRPVSVQLNVIRGRGRVQVTQQPSPSNNYTAGVLIEDDQAGDDNYEFELVW